MKFIPDLSFGGNCIHAIEYYKEIFKGEIIQIVTYEEAVIECNENDYNKIFSAVLVVGKNTLYFSDELYLENKKAETKLGIMIEFYNEEELREVFNNLAKEGKILLDISETNWGSLYGSIEDKYGFVWNFNYEMCII